MAKARKKRSGSLEKRGGIWLARWMINGKRFTRSTGESDKRKALAKLDEFTDPYRLKDEQRILEKQSARIRGIAAEIEQAEDALPALTFADGWTVYTQSQSRPRSGEVTLELYHNKYKIFVDWMRQRYPDITELRGVSREIAREFATELMSGTPEEEKRKIYNSRKWLKNFWGVRRKHNVVAELTDKEKETVALHKANAELNIVFPIRGATFNIYMNALALVWRHIAQHERARIKINPWSYNKDTGEGIRRIPLKRAERQHTRRPLTLEEVYNLLNAAQGEMRLLIAFGFYTGLRLGDICNLTWGNIDRVSGVLTVRSVKTDVETNTAIHPALARIIEAETKKRTGYIMPTMQARYSDRKTGRSALVHEIVLLFKSIGIQTQTKEQDGRRARPDCTFHSLRHTFVSALRNRGVALRTAQALAGHTNAEMTEHYTHMDERAVLTLPDITDKEIRANEQAAALPFIEAATSADKRKITVDDLRKSVADWTDEQRAEALRIIGAATPGADRRRGRLTHSRKERNR